MEDFKTSPAYGLIFYYFNLKKKFVCIKQNLNPFFILFVKKMFIFLCDQ